MKQKRIIIKLKSKKTLLEIYNHFLNSNEYLKTKKINQRKERGKHNLKKDCISGLVEWLDKDERLFLGFSLKEGLIFICDDLSSSTIFSSKLDYDYVFSLKSNKNGHYLSSDIIFKTQKMDEEIKEEEFKSEKIQDEKENDVLNKKINGTIFISFLNVLNNFIYNNLIKVNFLGQDEIFILKKSKETGQIHSIITDFEKINLIDFKKYSFHIFISNKISNDVLKLIKEKFYKNRERLNIIELNLQSPKY